MFTARPEILGTFGVVASTHWLASATGMGILERGGNAFDAAVAAGMVLQVATASERAGRRTTYENPLTLDYHGHTICKCGPWSQGPAMLQSLAMMTDMDVAAMDPLGADFVHTVVECMKLSYADHEAWYGDPGFADELASHGFEDVSFENMTLGIVALHTARKPDRPRAIGNP